MASSCENEGCDANAIAFSRVENVAREMLDLLSNDQPRQARRELTCLLTQCVRDRCAVTCWNAFVETLWPGAPLGARAEASTNFVDDRLWLLLNFMKGPLASAGPKAAVDAGNVFIVATVVADMPDAAPTRDLLESAGPTPTQFWGGAMPNGINDPQPSQTQPTSRELNAISSWTCSPTQPFSEKPNGAASC